MLKWSSGLIKSLGREFNFFNIFLNINMNKIFLDTEFTGFDQNTKLISIGLVSDDDQEFYAEFTDYGDIHNKWINENVINNLIYNEVAETKVNYQPKKIHVKGSSDFIKPILKGWLDQWKSVEIWAECPWYDFVLFRALISDEDNNLPDNIHYHNMKDFNTWYNALGFNINTKNNFKKNCEEIRHNSINDAKMLKSIFYQISDDVNIAAS